MRQYTFTVVIAKEPEDPGYYAHCPELPGCVSWGEDVEATRRNMSDAIRLYVESLIEDGLPVPQREDGVQVERMTVAFSA